MGDRAELVGKLIGDYHLLRRLGGGSFGTVYLGEHVREHTQVAIKVLHARLTRSDEMKAFINEARIMRLKHPHIVPILDFGITDDDTPFLVIEYAPYGTLRDSHPKGSQLSLSTVTSYVQMVASALHYAHSLRIIHRDVKPENMLVGIGQTILLSDFGITTIASSSSSLSVFQGIGGTLSYMAPEQLQGKPRPASDQYALGIVVYEWLVGKRPFTGTAVELSVQQMTTPPPSLCELRPALSTQVEQVVFTALAKDPKQRFATIEDFATALQEVCLQSEPSTFLASSASSIVSSHVENRSASVHLPTNQENVKEGTVVNQTFTTLSSLPLSKINGSLITQPVSTLPTTTVGSIPKRGSAYVPLPTSRNPQAFQRKRSLLKKKTTVFLFVLILLFIGSIGSLYAIVNRSIDQEQARRLTKTATAVDPYDRFVTTNGVMLGFDVHHTHSNPFEHRLNTTTVGGLTKKWTYRTGDAVDSSPAVINGVIYIGSNDGNVYALDAASGTKKWVYRIESPLSNYVYSSPYYVYSSPAVINGVVYIGSDDGNVYALDAASGTKKWTYSTGKSVFSSPTVINGVVYIGSDDGNVYALDAASGAKKWAYNTGDAIRSAAAVVNKTIYICTFGGVIYALDATSGTKKWTYNTGDVNNNTSPAVADGMVYIGTGYPGDNNIWALNAVSGAKKWVRHQHGNDIESSPAVINGVVYIGSDDGNIYALDAASGTEKWTYQTKDIVTSSPTVANGVVYVGSDDHNIYALDAASGTKKWAYQTGGAVVSQPAVVNGVVYVGSDDHSVYMFHLSSP